MEKYKHLIGKLCVLSSTKIYNSPTLNLSTSWLSEDGTWFYDIPLETSFFTLISVETKTKDIHWKRWLTGNYVVVTGLFPEFGVLKCTVSEEWYDITEVF
jgi:hypothetical protein